MPNKAQRVPRCQAAVILQEQQLTYRELDKRSNQVARYLQAQGVGREDRVAVLASRQVGTIVKSVWVSSRQERHMFPLILRIQKSAEAISWKTSDCNLLLQPDCTNGKVLASYATDGTEG
nr:AMP-binding protein [Brevibacillus brevis]